MVSRYDCLTPPIASCAADLDASLKETAAVRSLQEQLQKGIALVDSMRGQTEERVDAMHKHVESLLDRLKAAEEKLDARLYSLETQLKAQLDSLQAESDAGAGTWILPFVGLCAVVLVLAGVWSLQYRRITKMHLL